MNLIKIEMSPMLLGSIADSKNHTRSGVGELLIFSGRQNLGASLSSVDTYNGCGPEGCELFMLE